MIESEVIKDMVYVSHVLSLARVIALLDTDRIMRVLQSTDILSPCPLLGEMNNEMIEKMRTGLKLITFMSLELRNVLPDIDVLDETTKHLLDFLPDTSREELQSKIEKFVEEISKGTK